MAKVQFFNCRTEAQNMFTDSLKKAKNGEKIREKGKANQKAISAEGKAPQAKQSKGLPFDANDAIGVQANFFGIRKGNETVPGNTLREKSDRSLNIQSYRN